MKKHLFIFLILLLPLLSLGQDSIKTIRISSSLWDSKMPEGIAERPAFYVNGYAFYPEKQLIGIKKHWIPVMSSSGIGVHYISELHNADYNSFTFIDVNKGIARDKNNIYSKGENIGISPKNAHIIMHASYVDEDIMFIQKKDSVYIFDVRNNDITASYSVDKHISNFAFKKDSETFLFIEDDFYPLPKNEEEEDDEESPPKFKLNLRKLKPIDANIYQDNKNLYNIYDEEIEAILNEKIISKHTFTDYEEEQRNFTKGNDYIWVGKKNFYHNSDKLFNYKLQSYKFLDDSFYFFYNGCLYYFEGTTSTDIPVGANGKTNVDFWEFGEGLNDEYVVQRDYNKAKPLGKHMLLYDKELFYQKDLISYPANWDIRKLEYIGQFPYRLYIDLITENDENSCKINSPILRYNNQLYVICNDSLIFLKKIVQGDEYNDFDLSGLKFLNEYYFTDGKTLYCNDDIKRGMRNDSFKQQAYLTSNDIDLKNIKVYGKYFADGKKLYYSYFPVSNRSDVEYDAMKLILSEPYSFAKPKVKPTEADLDLSFINFNKLKLIPDTEYLTDEKYIIYKTNLIGMVDYKSIKIISPTIIEDSKQYFSKDFIVEKKKLKIKLQ